MCPAVAQLENGDPEEPVDFLCQVAHLRALALAGPAAIQAHGPCEYCPGGEHHEAATAAAGRLKHAATGAWPGPSPRQSLPVLASLPGEASGDAGCGGLHD